MKAPRRARLLILIGVAFGVAVVGYLYSGGNPPLIDDLNRAHISTVPLPTVPPVHVVAPLVPQPTPQVPLPPLPTATPVIPPSLAVQWEDVGLFFDFAHATELRDPFGDERVRREETLATPTTRPVLGPSLWGLYVVAPDGTPEQVHATRRWLRSLQWDGNDGPSVTYRTMRLADSPVLGRRVLLEWDGRLLIDSSTGRIRDEMETFPRDHPRFLPGEENPVLRIQRNKAGDALLVTLDRYAPSPGILINAESVSIVDEFGRARHLRSAEFPALAWIPNGKALFGRDWLSKNAYFVPTEDGVALSVERAAGGVVEGLHDRPGTLNLGSRVALQISDSSPLYGHVPEYTLSIYDSNSHVIRSLATVVATGYLPRPMMWKSGSDKVWVGSQLVDVNSGDIEQSTFLGFTPPPPDLGAVSPSGRYRANAEGDRSRSPECAGLPFRLYVEDMATGGSRNLFECRGGNQGKVLWLSDQRLVLDVEGWSGSSYGHRILLAEVDTGLVRSLTDGFERNPLVSPSPDGTRVLVSGDRLRIYSQDAVLLLDHGPPPEGFAFQSPIWAPDGSTYAFLLGPENWSPWP